MNEYERRKLKIKSKQNFRAISGQGTKPTTIDSSPILRVAPGQFAQIHAISRWSPFDIFPDLSYHIFIFGIYTWVR
jgi:hypothetical protein